MKLYSKDRWKKRHKLYSSTAWRKRSLQHRKNNPLCVRCLARGQHRLSVVADHDNPLWKGREILTSKLNALCRECHTDKTLTEDLPKMQMSERTAFKFFD